MLTHYSGKESAFSILKNTGHEEFYFTKTALGTEKGIPDETGEDPIGETYLDALTDAMKHRRRSIPYELLFLHTHPSDASLLPSKGDMRYYLFLPGIASASKEIAPIMSIARCNANNGGDSIRSPPSAVDVILFQRRKKLDPRKSMAIQSRVKHLYLNESLGFLMATKIESDSEQYGRQRSLPAEDHERPSIRKVLLQHDTRFVKSALTESQYFNVASLKVTEKGCEMEWSELEAFARDEVVTTSRYVEDYLLSVPKRPSR